MIETLLTAIAIGFSAGCMPGPLSVAVVQQTLQRGLWQGIKVSLTPLITDGPIILCSLWVLTYFRSSQPLIALISLLGGLYLLRLGLKMLLSESRVELEQSGDKSDEPGVHSVKEGQLLELRDVVRINLLNPNPYLFWTTVGGAYIVSGDSWEALAFTLALLLSVIGAKATQAVITSVFRGRGPLLLRRCANRGFGLALALFAATYLKKAYLIALT